MYSEYKSIQLLIAALKLYKIQHIVLSPGGSDIPIIHSLENDSFFHCYSVVDERSAVYFGIGISQSLNQPVACVCTSGTAVSNFLPGMTEAYYQNTPIIAITADKDPRFQGQIETQKIEQKNIFGEISLKSVELPFSNVENDNWYCERLIKEALTTALHGSQGPVHINIPIIGPYNNYSCNSLPKIRPVSIINCETTDSEWKKYVTELSNAQRILVIVGQNILFSTEDIHYIEMFYERYNCAISVEHISNLNCKGCIFTYPITETSNTKDALIPDLVISLGNNVSSYGMKPFLRKHYTKFKHYSIDASGRYRDAFKGLNVIFECTPRYFFKYFSTHAPQSIQNNGMYYNTWNEIANKLKTPEFPFSNYYVAEQLAAIIPSDSLLHLAILNSTRIFHFFKLKYNVRVFSNVGALGIDGCLSTFVGQAAVTNKLAFCVIGDLSFFYDMNAAGIKHIQKNIRIILLNNGGGAEFHLFMNKSEVPTLNHFICAEHHKIAKGWIESLGFNYYQATNKDELDTCINLFSEESDTPLFLEIFTDKEIDAEISTNFYKSLYPEQTIIDKMKNIAKKIINIAQ